MNIFQRSITKKQILKNIDNSRVVFAEMKKCLVPAQNINWCHRIDSRNYFNNEDHLSLLKLSIPTYFSYINEFVELYEINKKLCLDYPKLNGFSEYHFISQLTAIRSHITSLIENIQELEDYGRSTELIKTIKLLRLALNLTDEKINKVANIKKVEKDDSLEI